MVRQEGSCFKELVLPNMEIMTGFQRVLRGKLLQQRLHLVILLLVTDTLLEHDLLGTQTLACNAIASSID